jgi:long-chain acyl-CoA synthetase
VKSASRGPWVEHWPKGTKSDIDPLPWENLGAMVDATCARFNSKKAFTQSLPNGLEGSLTFEQVRVFADGFARVLRKHVGEGTRVAIQLPNSLSVPVAVFGVFKAGCVVVNVNPLYTPSELNHQLRNSGAKALVVMDLFGGRLDEALKGTEVEHVWVASLWDFMPFFKGVFVKTALKFIKKSVPKIPVSHHRLGRDVFANLGSSPMTKRGLDDVAVLQYTGGTTGVSKGAMLTHRNLLSNLMQVFEVMQSEIRPGAETILTVLPLYHVFAFTGNLLLFFLNGAHNILIPSPRPLSNLSAAMKKWPLTWMSGVNTLYSGLAMESWFQQNPPKTFRACISGGMSLHTSVSERWKQLTGVNIIEGYGLTEASPIVAFNPIGGKIKLGTIGIPVPSTEIRLIDAEGNDVAIGSPGELCIKGPQVMRGYWNADAETQNVLRDGWLHTGDVATMDADGFLTIVDRLKEMVKVSGFNVFPSEIEEVIARCPGVKEVGVIGIPDEKTGEAIRAFVVTSRQDLDESEIRKFCAEFLTKYKVPKVVTIVAELPKSPVGKILRKELKKLK